MSSCLQWNIGSDVSSSAKMHPIAHMSESNQGEQFFKGSSEISLRPERCDEHTGESPVQQEWAHRRKSSSTRMCEYQPTYGLCVMSGTQKQLWRSVPESHHHGIKIGQRLQRRIEQPRKSHVGWNKMQQLLFLVTLLTTSLREMFMFKPILTRPLSGPSPMTRILAGFWNEVDNFHWRQSKLQITFFLCTGCASLWSVDCHNSPSLCAEPSWSVNSVFRQVFGTGVTSPCLAEHSTSFCWPSLTCGTL